MLLNVPSIAKLCDSNMGGLRLLRVIPLDGVQSIPTAVGHSITAAITLKPGASISDVFFTEDTGSFEEPAEIGEQGKLYRQRISVVIPKDAPEIADYVNLYDGMECICQYMDSNGFAKLIGSLSQPLRFEASFNTGTTAEERNAYTFSYRGSSYHKAYFYPYFINPVTGGRGYGFFSPSVSWGSIVGSIEDQTDLVNYLAEAIANIPPVAWGFISGNINAQADLVSLLRKSGYRPDL